ncbi:39S ribosomal protein L28, mitochondrial [Cimex lectularius]|uniref:39S ribosomal protein L28, mitochondrial n=1 Tax=Cimex lectularius TaxID=79782 RepID=A0A8I6S3P8_CIMLE|nr:39S ribosomal protein L28, mitochondrial [Cimex lectularius]
MSASRAVQAGRVFSKFKYDALVEEGSHLPESYKKFYTEWKKMEPSPVHYRHKTDLTWVRNKYGEMKRVDDFPIPLLYPPEMHKGIWGGEAVIKGFQKRTRLKKKVPHFWFPILIKSAVYSEVLNKTMDMTMTNRTIDLIFENFGFDHYILKTPACDLQSSLALKLKRKILHVLYYNELYPDDEEKRKEVYNKYKHYLNDYTEEDIKWYGLTLPEALKKYEKENKITPVPLKHEFRMKLIQLLMSPPEETDPSDKEEKRSSWLSKINPFSKES